MTMLTESTAQAQGDAPVVKWQRVGETVYYGNVTDWLYVSNIPDDQFNGTIFTNELPSWAEKMPPVGDWLYVPTTTTTKKKTRNRKDSDGWTKEERAAAREEERRIKRENSAKAREETRKAREETRKAREETRRIAALQKTADRVRRENRQHMGRYGLPRTIAVFDLGDGEHWRYQMLSSLAVQDGQRYIVRYRVNGDDTIREYNPTHAVDWVPQELKPPYNPPISPYKMAFKLRGHRGKNYLFRDILIPYGEPDDETPHIYPMW